MYCNRMKFVLMKLNNLFIFMYDDNVIPQAGVYLLRPNRLISLSPVSHISSNGYTTANNNLIHINITGN